MTQVSQGKWAERPYILWIGELCRLFIGFAILALLTRAVTPDVLGAYLSMTTLVLLAPRLLDLGLPHALGYFLRVEPDRLHAATRMMARHVVLALPAAILLAFALRFFPFAEAGVARLGEEHWLRLALLIVSELGILLGLASLLPTGRFFPYLATTLTPPLVLVSALQVVPASDLDAGRLLDLLLFSSLCGCVAMVWGLVRASRVATGATFPVRDAYGYGMSTYGSAIGKIAAQRFDRLFLVSVLGTAGYAHYNLAISVRDLAVFPANLYAMTLRNRQIDMVARRGELAASRRLLWQVTATWLGIGTVGAIVMYALWPALVRFAFGDRYLETAEFLRIVSFSCGPLAVMGFAWNHLYALRRPARVTILTWTSLLIALPTFGLLIQLIGPTQGVAVAVVAWAVLTALASFGLAMPSSPPAQVPHSP